MEPTLPHPHGSPEVGPNPLSPESQSPQSAEVQPSPERQESHERKVTGDGGGQPQPVQQPVQPAAVPLPPAPPAPVAPAAQPTDDAPATAGDDDLIEKEWVDKAKHVIAQTRHDPYMQELAVSRLQADYLQKRYGKTVKLPDEG